MVLVTGGMSNVVVIVITDASVVVQDANEKEEGLGSDDCDDVADGGVLELLESEAEVVEIVTTADVTKFNAKLGYNTNII